MTTGQSSFLLDPQHPLESPFEVCVAERVQDGVERRVEVSEPDARGVQALVDAGAAAVGDHHEQGEVGQPAEDEGADDDAELSGRLLLLRQDHVRGPRGRRRGGGGRRGGRHVVPGIQLSYPLFEGLQIAISFVLAYY